MLRQIVVALLLTVWFSPPPARAEAPAVTQPQASSRPAPGTAAEAQQLAQRERQAHALESFEGGGRGGTVATSSVVIILLLVIILVLII